MLTIPDKAELWCDVSSLNGIILEFEYTFFHVPDKCFGNVVM